MKDTRFFYLVFAALVTTVGLGFSSQALASCRKNSKSAQDMQMSDDMPMCCKMKMDKAKNGAAESMESMGKHEMSGMSDEKGGQAAKKEKENVKDPVCSMTVDPKTAEKSVYKGKTYYFCSKEDKDKFERSPEKYVKQQRSN